MKNQQIFYSSNSDEYATPDEFYRMLDTEFRFNLDPCSTDENAKCEKHFTKAENGLLQNWGGYTVFCNPPYSNIKEWVKKAYDEAHGFGGEIVLLIPARTDTKYFHDYIYHKAEIRFIKGRLKFGNSKNSAPFPSMIVIYRRLNND